MKRTLLLLTVLCAALAATVHVGTASASSCRDRIYNDWYADGKIASTYPRSCYLDALKHIPPDAAIYSDLADDIRAALRLSLARAQGRNVAPTVGHGFSTTSHNELASAVKQKTKDPKSTDAKNRLRNVSAAPVADTSSGGGLPLPVLLLGALAIALAAAGVLGMGVRRLRGR